MTTQVLSLGTCGNKAAVHGHSTPGVISHARLEGTGHPRGATTLHVACAQHATSRTGGTSAPVYSKCAHPALKAHTPWGQSGQSQPRWVSPALAAAQRGALSARTSTRGHSGQPHSSAHNGCTRHVLWYHGRTKSDLQVQMGEKSVGQCALVCSILAIWCCPGLTRCEAWRPAGVPCAATRSAAGFQGAIGRNCLGNASVCARKQAAKRLAVIGPSMGLTLHAVGDGTLTDACERGEL